MPTPRAIADLRAVPVRVPRRPALLPRTAHGEVTHSEYVLVQVTLHSGQRGIGEITTAPSWNGEDAIGSVDLVNRLLAPRLRGIDVDDEAAVLGVVDRAVKQRPFLRAGIEMACLDATAREDGVRVVDLLGGARQERFLNRMVLPAREDRIVARMAEHVLEGGAERLKVKVGTGIDADLERIRVVRELHAGPLSVDANEGWRPDQHERIVAGAATHAIASIEQPYPRGQRTASRDLQEETGASLLADESVWTRGDVDSIADDRSFDAVSLYPGKLGGLRRFLEAVRVAEDRGLAVVLGSNLELGVGAAAMAHALAATTQTAEGVGHDLIGPLYFEHPLVVDAGFVGYATASLPAGPGLGVALDTDAVARYAISADPVDPGAFRA